MRSRVALTGSQRAVRDCGGEPVDVGEVPTPALMLYAVAKGTCSIMVTGSHIPFDRNGIKFNRASGEVLKSDEGPILAAVRETRERVSPTRGWGAHRRLVISSNNWRTKKIIIGLWC